MSKALLMYAVSSAQFKASFSISMALFGIMATTLSILGISLADWNDVGLILKIGVIFVGLLLMTTIIYFVLGYLYKNTISIMVSKNFVTIEYGDIFKESGLKVIGCDNQFATKVDDSVISESSLHGQLVLKYGKVREIKEAIKKATLKKQPQAAYGEPYDFPLGTIIRYDSSVSGETYLMLAMTKLNSNFEARTTIREYLETLMTMWREINRVYAGNDIVLPLLGAGITRFDDGLKSEDELLRCMLWTLSISRVMFNSRIKILLSSKADVGPLYEYRGMF